MLFRIWEVQQVGAWTLSRNFYPVAFVVPRQRHVSINRREMDGLLESNNDKMSGNAELYNVRAPVMTKCSKK